MRTWKKVVDYVKMCADDLHQVSERITLKPSCDGRCRTAARKRDDYIIDAAAAEVTPSRDFGRVLHFFCARRISRRSCYLVIIAWMMM